MNCEICNHHCDPFHDSPFAGHYQETDEISRREIEGFIIQEIDDIASEINKAHTKQRPYTRNISRMYLEFLYDAEQYERNVSVTAFRTYGNVYMIRVTVSQVTYSSRIRCQPDIVELDSRVYSSPDELRDSVDDILTMIFAK